MGLENDINKLRSSGITEDDIRDMVDIQLVSWALNKLEKYDIFYERNEVNPNTGMPHVVRGFGPSWEIIRKIKENGGLNKYWKGEYRADNMMYLAATLGVDTKLLISTALECIDKYIPQSMLTMYEDQGVATPYRADEAVNTLLLATIKATGHWLTCGSGKSRIKQILYSINNSETLGVEGRSTGKSALYAIEHLCKAIVEPDDYYAGNLMDAIYYAAEAGDRIMPEREPEETLSGQELCLQEMSYIIEKHIKYSMLEDRLLARKPRRKRKAG